jgi:hypothetical protein
MVQYLIEENIIIYIFAGLCGIGFITRLILDLVYNHFVRESNSMGSTKNKQLKHMKLKFETCYKLKIGVNNVDTFVDKNVYKHRFCGILLSTWENFGGQVLFLSLLLVPVSAVFGVAFDSGQDKVLLTGAVGILASAILIIVDKSINLSNKKAMIKLNLEDYFGNFCKVRLEQEAFHPEELEQYRKEYFQSVEARKQISAASAATKEEPKAELDRRREARRKKEEEKRLQAIKRAEEQKRLEEARKEEERRRMEERKQLAAKRREEELKKLEEERAALEARKAEAKRKSEERQRSNLRKQHKNGEKEEKEEMLHSREEDLLPAFEEKDKDPGIMIRGVEEIPVEKEMDGMDKPQLKAVEAKKKGKSISTQEEKLVEDILKEFFA